MARSGDQVTPSDSEENGNSTDEEPLSEGSSAPQSPADSLPRSASKSRSGGQSNSRFNSPSKSRSKSRSNNKSPDSDDSASIDQTQWNAIIPEPSTTVPEGNNPPQRPGRGRQALVTPAHREQVSTNQMAWRLWAMRQLLGEPVGITDDELRTALVASGWDLGGALRRMNNALNEARHRHRTNAPNRSLAMQQRDRLLGAESLHHNRRLGIELLYTRLEPVVPQHQRHMLTTLTLGELLADHRFDMDEAINAFLERLLHPCQIERHQRAERRLRLLNPDPAHNLPNALHMDQRVARFMEIAGTDDFFSAYALLDQYGGDLHRAMDHWMRNGFATHPPPASSLQRSLFRTPRRPHTDIEDLWPHPRPLAGPLNNVDAADIADARLNYGQGEYEHQEGWFIRYPREEARIGINIPTRLRNDYIRGGMHTVVEVRDVERPDGSGIRDPFDYNNSEHIKHLNNQASQWIRRTLGKKTKERGAFYQHDENEWIWRWHNERHWELIEQHPELLDATTAADWQAAGVRWPMRIDPQQLTRDFNNHWTPRRQPRDTRSLDAQRRRIMDICNDFGLPFSPPHRPQDKKKKKQPKYSTSGSEGDEDESGDDNVDGTPKAPRKKPKSKPKSTPQSTPKKSAEKGKGKQKADTMSDIEEAECSDGEKSPPSTKKGGSGTSKRKRNQDDDDSDYEGPASTPSGKRGGGVRKSARKHSKD